ncbi:MAG: DUF4911 domain-containing protein [Deferribacteraceae bacterium]|jgi:hypothetical protein|nr:DUF4911 domain-containing protein [Deferribacteraceae bacterium]
MIDSYTPDPLNCAPACRVHLKVAPPDIIYLNGILDSYEGLGIMRTVDEKHGKAVVYTTIELESTVLSLLNALSGEGVRVSVENVDYEDIVDDKA